MKSVKIIIASTLAIIAALASQPVKAQSSTSGYSPEGVVLSKNVVAGSEPNSYTINLETYVTGSSITTTGSSPLDVILVLDFSGSILSTKGRFDALQAASISFIEEIQKYQATNNNGTRLGVVSFNGSATQGPPYAWDLTGGFVDPTGDKVNELLNHFRDTEEFKKDFINNTYINEGMRLAKEMLDKQPSTQSKKCVVVFSDGAPTSSGSPRKTAQEALDYAYIMKNTYKAEVFSVLLGDDEKYKIFYRAYENEPTYYIGEEVVTDSPLTTKSFMERMSSHYPEAKIINLYEQDRPFGASYKTDVNVYYNSGWKVPFNDEFDYYQYADNSNLKSIFLSISDRVIGGASYELKETTTAVIDVVSPAFMLPEGVDENAISLRVAKYGQVIASGTDGSSEYGFFEPYDPKNAPTGETGFPNIVAKIGKLQKIDGGTQFSEAPDGKASSEFKAVSITGFDFSDNWVGVDVHDDQETPRGYKLIISFPIVIDPNNPGGASSQTNTEDSGIYIDKDGDGKYDQIGSFEIPSVKIPNIVILKYGLKKGDSAIFKVFKVEEEGTESQFPIMLVATQGDGEYAIAKTKIQQPGRYKVVETAWSWAYTSTCESSYVNDDAGITDNDVWHSKGYGIGDETGYQAMKPYKLGTETTDNSITRNVNDFTEAEKEGEYKGTLFIFRNEAKNNIPAHGESFKNNVFFQTIR